jgi:hypothetical protein
LACSAVIVGLVLAAPRPLRAEAFAWNDTTWEGCSELLELARRELGRERVVVQSVLDWSQITAADGVLLVHPLRAVDAEEATSFMKSGGRLAVVDDYGRGDTLLGHFHIERRALPARPAAALRDRPALPIAEPPDEEGHGAAGPHPTVQFVEAVALNHGSGFQHPDLTVVLVVPAVDEQPVAFAVAGQVEEGRLFAVGDGSIFINQMMRYPGNQRFAAGLVQYLLAGDRPGAPSAGKLFVLANEFEERGGFGGVTPWRKSIDRAFESLARAIGETRRAGPPGWLRTVAAALTALLAGYLAWRALGRFYHPRSPRFARPTPLLAQAGVPGRVALLQAPTSPPALALLEVRSALTEAIAVGLGRAPRLASVDVVHEVLPHADLDESARARLRALLRRMQDAEHAVVGGQLGTIKRREVIDAWRLCGALLGHLRVPVRRVNEREGASCGEK